MSNGLQTIENMQLKPALEDGKVVKTRLGTADTIRNLFNQAVLDDQGSALARLKVQAMKDGEPPFNQAALNASGQGSRANANFLLGQDLITKANNGYLDILTTSKCLVTLDVEFGEPTERSHYEDVLQQELTRTIRKWDEFTPNFLQIVDIFDTHGVAITTFLDTKNFRFEVTKLGEFFIPRQTKVSENRVLWAIARKDTTVNELYEAVEDEETAKAEGWNVAAVKKAIARENDNASNGDVGEYERLQQQLKNNDLFAARKFSHVQTLYGWFKEPDGSYTYAITLKDDPTGDYLFRQNHKYKSAEEAFIFFCYGVGNGTYHSIRGLGHMIFALVQLFNRLMCQKADGVMLDESIMVQAGSSEGLNRASVNYLGPLSMIDGDFDIVDRKMSGGSDRTLPYLNEVKGLMGQMSSRFNTPANGRAGVYENKLNSEMNLETIASGETGAIDLFYLSLDKLFRQMCTRIINGPKTDPLVGEFHRRIKKAGVTPEVLKSIDFDSIYAYRALGAGSPAARSISFKKLLEILPQLPEDGRKNLIYRFVADAVGYQNAEEFASPAGTPRVNVETGQAILENALLLMGNEIPVVSSQMHATHAQIHIPAVTRVLEAIETGEMDPMENLPGLQAALNHLAAHGEELAIDPTQKALYGEVKETVNNIQQVVTNMGRKIAAAERKFREEGGVEGGEAGGDEQQVALAKLKQEEIKAALAEFKLQAAQELHNLKMASEQSKINQNLAMGDLKGAELAAKSLRFPGSSYSQRR